MPGLTSRGSRGMAPLFAQIREGVKFRQARGILPPKFVYPIVIAACRDLIRGEPFDQSGKKSALLEDFEGKISALKDAPAVKQQLVADARAALLGSVKPAYMELMALLQEQEEGRHHR